MIITILLALQSVTSINQTGGITAGHVDTVTCNAGQRCDVTTTVRAVPLIDTACLARNGWFRFDPKAKVYNRTKRFKAMNDVQRGRAIVSCWVQVR